MLSFALGATTGWVFPQQALAQGNTATTADIASPDGYTCNQRGSVGFENLPDGTTLPGTIAGLDFVTTGGHTWLVGDFATGHYNGKYPNGKYMSEGTHWAWLGESQGSGRINMANGPASYFSLLVSVGNTPVYLEAYDVTNNLVATAGPASYNIETGHMTELKITRAQSDIAYVVVHDTGNFFLVDSICTDAPGVSEFGHAGCSAVTTPRNPSLQVSVEGNNNSDTAAGNGWAPNAQVNIYLDTAWGAHYIGTALTNSVGEFTAAPLAPFADFLPTEPAELEALPNETFPIIAMDGSCDAATVASLTPQTPRTSLSSSTSTYNGGCSPAGVVLSPGTEHASPQLPLHTDGRWIVDSSNTTPPTRVKLTSVNWYGAEEADFVPGGLQCQNVETIAGEIAKMGFNSVRLPWSNAMYEQDASTCTAADLALTGGGTNKTCIPPEVLAANHQLLGQSAMSILQAVVTALAKHHIMVILDNHGTDADFTPTPFDGVWWGGQYWDDLFGYRQQISMRTSLWMSDWVGMVNAFQSQPDVVGVDLRNEPTETIYCDRILFVRIHCVSPRWSHGTTPGVDNWPAAAERAGDAILGANRKLLVMVEGIKFSGDLTGVHGRQVKLVVPNRVVYAPHSYSSHNPEAYEALEERLGREWGYILTQNKRWTAPVWVGEFGATASDITPQTAVGGNCENTGLKWDDRWFSCFTKYLSKADIDWSWWAVNGTESDGGQFDPNPSDAGHRNDRQFYGKEIYGIFDPSWSANSSGPLIEALHMIQPQTQGP
jgi:endoglucanase